MATFDFPIVGKYQHCEHGYDHPPWPHSCDGCFCDDVRDLQRGWIPLTYEPPKED